MVGFAINIYCSNVTNGVRLLMRPRYLQVHTVVPSDGGVLQKLGETFDRLGDRQQAFQYYSDVIAHVVTVMQLAPLLIGNNVESQLVVPPLSFEPGRNPLAGSLFHGDARSGEGNTSVRAGRTNAAKRSPMAFSCGEQYSAGRKLS